MAPTTCVEPATDTERRLELIWRRELRLPGPISTTQSFFDIGGSSLVALRVFPAIEREFSVKLSLALLFDNLTIMTLAAAIDQETAQAHPWETVVTIQPHGHRAPLFAFPALRGSAVISATCRSTSTRSGPCTWSRRSASTVGGAHADALGVADDAAEAIRRVQPHGPYYLTGFCFGWRRRLRGRRTLGGRR